MITMLFSAVPGVVAAENNELQLFALEAPANAEQPDAQGPVQVTNELEIFDQAEAILTVPETEMNFVHISFQTNQDAETEIHASFLGEDGEPLADEPVFRKYTVNLSPNPGFSHFKQIFIPKDAVSLIYTIEATDNEGNIAVTEEKTIFLTELDVVTENPARVQSLKSRSTPLYPIEDSVFESAEDITPWRDANEGELKKLIWSSETPQAFKVSVPECSTANTTLSVKYVPNSLILG